MGTYFTDFDVKQKAECSMSPDETVAWGIAHFRSKGLRQATTRTRHMANDIKKRLPEKYQTDDFSVDSRGSAYKDIDSISKNRDVEYLGIIKLFDD